MARDYKSRAAPRSGNQRSGSCVIWFLAGCLLGAFAVALVWLKAEQPGVRVPGVPVADSGPPRGDKERLPKPRFDFYNILPEMEVVVPEEEIVPRPRTEKPPPAPKVSKVAKPRNLSPSGPASSSRDAFLLQIGSFRKHADAERVRAQLALLGIESRIQKVTINNRDTFHRVRSGPYRGSKALNEARAVLKRNGIKSIVIKLKNG